MRECDERGRGPPMMARIAVAAAAVLVGGGFGLAVLYLWLVYGNPGQTTLGRLQLTFG